MKDVTTLAADNIRILAASMVEKSKSGHPGGAMGGADFINILYTEFLKYNPDDPTYPLRDRFFLDPGHMSPMLYSVLALAGYFTLDELKDFRQWGSPTPGHPERDLKRAIENTSGPLGQGHAMALGAAIAERFMVERFGEWMAHKTFAFISDGGIQEEVSQGVGRIAGHLGLHNFIMFYDSNNIQLSTKVDEVSTEDIVAKYEAWGWNVISIDGNDGGEIRMALTRAVNETEKPTLIVGHTVMGKGALGKEGESFENKVSTHGQPLTAAGADIAKTVANLGGDPENPFVIFDDVKKLYAERAAELRKWVALRREEEKSSADLSNSDKTDGFLKKTRAISKEDMGGRFLQPGVCEFTMACIMNGMALHGGIVPACGTFFVFSDYMKPALRLSALMRLPVKFIWTHDSFRVGEDGPTHQPVEHEAQLRLMEQLRNHEGERSVVVLRPADARETVAAWKIAMEEQRPTALVLSRQNIKDLPTLGGSRAEEAMQAVKGAYIVMDCEGKPDVILLASGSEVATLVDGAEKLKADGVKVRVVSVPSEGLFRDQSAEYQQSVLPAGVPKFGLTSGLPVTLAGLVGCDGEVFGLDHFGYSAPAGVLDGKFGFSGENVYNRVKAMLKK